MSIRDLLSRSQVRDSSMRAELGRDDATRVYVKRFGC